MKYIALEVHDQKGNELIVSALKNGEKFFLPLSKAKIVKEDVLHATATFALTKKTAEELGILDFCLTSPGISGRR